VDALKVKLTPVEAARIADIPTKSLEAHDLFLRGRELIFSRKWTREIFNQLVAHTTRAIELDPNYAEAYAGLGFAHHQDFHNRFTGSPNALDIAEHFASIAVEKGPTAPFPHWVLAAVTLWKKKFDVVKRETEIALALNPNYALAWNTRGNAEAYSGHPPQRYPILSEQCASIRRIRSNTPTFLHQLILSPVNTRQLQHPFESASGSHPKPTYREAC